MSTQTARRWTFTVLGIPSGPNAHVDWRVRHKRVSPMRDDIAWQARAAAHELAAPLEHATVTITLYRKQGQAAQDPDNAMACVKCLVDGLVVGKLLVDDSGEHITLTVMQEIGTHRWSKVEVLA